MPRRRCVGCGRIAPKADLVRLAVADRRSATAGGARTRRAVIDAAGVMPGRGAYLCRAPGPDTAAAVGCLQLAERRGGIARALRCAVRIEPADRPAADSELVESPSGWRSRPQAGEPGPSNLPITR